MPLMWPLSRGGWGELRGLVVLRGAGSVSSEPTAAELSDAEPHLSPQPWLHFPAGKSWTIQTQRPFPAFSGPCPAGLELPCCSSRRSCGWRNWYWVSPSEASPPPCSPDRSATGGSCPLTAPQPHSLWDLHEAGSAGGLGAPSRRQPLTAPPQRTHGPYPSASSPTEPLRTPTPALCASSGSSRAPLWRRVMTSEAALKGPTPILKFKKQSNPPKKITRLTFDVSFHPT